jgi:AcrR family transcriptional regulator
LVNPMRRKPQQARGQRRVNTILEAASQVFSELGYEAATTNIIAIRANTSIGSLYQFFPNKEAILNALVSRYHTQIASLLQDSFPDRALPLDAYCVTLIDALAGFYAANPAFRPLFHATPASSAMRAAADDVCSQIEENCTRALIAASADCQTEVCAFYAEVVVCLLRALIPMIKAPDDRQKIAQEARRAVLAYLAATGDFKVTLPGREL